MINQSIDTVRLLLPDDTVQTIPLEEYLRGVVPAEMPPSWPLEALKAQAVAARSYAAYAALYPRHAPDADLCATTHCQAYVAEHAGKFEPTDAAVRRTAGEILTYQGEVANTLYSHDCGGHTIPNEEGFGSPDFVPPAVPYLRGVDCPSPGPKRGHGVGMCQVGAKILAERGMGHREILAHYYGTEVTKRGEDKNE